MQGSQIPNACTYMFQGTLVAGGDLAGGNKRVGKLNLRRFARLAFDKNVQPRALFN